MALFRYPHSKSWYYDFQFDGIRYRQSTKTRSKTLALEAERARRRQLEEGFNSVNRRQRPKMFAQAAQEYLEAKSLTLRDSSLRIEGRCITRLTPWFGRKVLNDIRAADMKQYQVERLKDGSAAKTINLDLSTLRAMLRRNKLWQDIQIDFRMLKAREDVGFALTLAEEDTVLEGCKKSLCRALYHGAVLALCSCARSEEIRLLRWKQVNFKARLLTIGKSKTRHGEGRKIPMNDRLFRVLQEWADLFPTREPEHFVFPSEHVVGPQKPKSGHVKYKTDPTKPLDWKKAWQAVLKRINFRCRFHDLRHTGCTRMLEAGVPFAVVAEIMGWSAATAILMSKRYGHIGQPARKAAVAALEGSPMTSPIDVPATELTPEVTSSTIQ